MSESQPQRINAQSPLASAWHGARLVIVSLFVATMMFVLGAAAARDSRDGPASASLEQELHETRRALSAREGELELAYLELQRMSRIIEQSAAHHIPADLATAIHDIAVSEGIDPALAFSLVRVESGFTRRAVSSAGAVGFTQVMPQTAFWLKPGIRREELFERDTNLRLGFRYLRLMLDQYDGDLTLALLAYNRGPGRVDEILRAGGNPANGYSLAIRNNISGHTRSAFRLRTD